MQTIETFTSDKESKVIVKEVNSFRGIPYADYFNVNTEWIVTSAPQPIAPTNNEKPISPFIYVSIYLDFTFHKSTWLQGTIESNTKAELIEVFELWRDTAIASIKAAAEKESRNNAVNVPASESMMDFDNENDIEGGISLTSTIACTTSGISFFFYADLQCIC